MRLGLVLLLALGGLVSAGAAPSWACSCAVGSTAERVAAADAVFVGQVSDQHGPTETTATTDAATASPTSGGQRGLGPEASAPAQSGRGWVIGLALVTGLLAIWTLGRGGRATGGGRGSG